MITIPVGHKPNGHKAAISLDILRTSHLLVQGASGSGKSYLLRVLAEQMSEHIQTFVIDPEGEYSTLREKFPFVLVGEGGETPARVDTAQLLARRLLEIGANAVCDLYALEKVEQQRWVREFFSALMALPRSLWKPLVVIIDEAHLFAPEKGEGNSESTRTVEDFASRCRKHGICMIVATQRITKISNNVASECQNYMIGRTFIQTDRERAAKALGIPNRQAEKDEFFNDLKVLQRGQFWALGVAIETERVMVTVQKALTTHPEPGALGGHKLPAPSEVKALLPKLADLPKQAEEDRSELENLRLKVSEMQEAADSAEEMRQQLETARQLLEQAEQRANEVEATPRYIAPDLEPVRERITQAASNMTAALDVKLADLQAAIGAIGDRIGGELDSIRIALDEQATVQTVSHVPIERRSTVTSPLPTLRTVVPHKPAPVTSEQHASKNGSGHLSGPQLEILVRLSEFRSAGRPSVQLAWLAGSLGTTQRARGFEENMRVLKKLELVEAAEGGVRLTSDGLSVAGVRPKLSGNALHDKLKRMLSGPQADMLTAMLHSRNGFTLEQLAERFNTTVRARGFEENVRFLRSNDLIERAGDNLRVASWLWV